MTKDLATLSYHFPSLATTFTLSQTDTSNSTGSSLWLSSQLLSSHLIALSHCHRSTRRDVPHSPKGRAIELGSGTGLLSFLLARLGWQVIATDIEPVLSTVLRNNVKAARYQLAFLGSSGSVEVRHLDWEREPAEWSWNNAEFITPTTSDSQATATTMSHFDLILTADTVYEPSLIRPLFRSLSHLYFSHSSFHPPPAMQDVAVPSQPPRQPKPNLLLALERRDGATIDAALEIARREFHLDFQRIPHRKVRKTFETFGDGRTWKSDDWQGVEIWHV